MSDLDTLSEEHPENSPAATAMRDVDCVRSVSWAHDRRYNIQFTLTTTEEEREAFLDEIEEECGLTPTDFQPRGFGVLVHREFVDIEIEGTT